ncbi:c-type cytochrome [Massilia sp. TS11]|uniref:c-type cytochrome n=1 Tax=Massilia sp. TS11 TaxID=2908003 RepID=UPI001EDB7EAF|nr:c-type cytochrome [Massilia sp. TS11]MCG2586376.1 c-type cytochrome [Massilia sp. TS11]
MRAILLAVAVLSLAATPFKVQEVDGATGLVEKDGVATVAKGSIAKGENIAFGMSGKAADCAACHGEDLHGSGIFPDIAGKAPSYTLKQLRDFKSGARSGPNAGQMQSLTAALDEDDMLALAAYLATQPAK